MGVCGQPAPVEERDKAIIDIAIDGLGISGTHSAKPAQ